MTFGELWGVALGTVLALGLFLGLFVFKAALKRSLFPDESRYSREQAMTDLLMRQAELEERAEASEGLSSGRNPPPGLGPEEGDAE